MNTERGRGIEWNPEFEAHGITREAVDMHNGLLEKLGISNIWELFEIHEPWTASGLMREFLAAVERVEAKFNTSFGMEKISFFFVTPEELNAKSEEERKALEDEYGKYIIDNIAGECEEVDDGYHIRIGILGSEGEVKKSEVASHLGHELGHTIGGVFLDDPVHEELKAYLFSSIVMDEMRIIDISLEEDPSRVHVAARILRERLSDAHVPEAAAIATLIGEPFLGFEPRNIDFERDVIRLH